ncbi:MAG: helix-turn-helix domain-containing protein [Thermodesulfobacteriota bacterium]|nr:helix-turn-helix domain-containing protein [Thermodesulfobacteriota bacterium]
MIIVLVDAFTDQHIAQLRKKLEKDPTQLETILTVHGVGYRLNK